MRTISIMFGIAVCALASCTSTPAPPCATLLVDSNSIPSGAYWAQGLWVGNHFLTALHPFVAEEGNQFPPSSVVLNGERVSVLHAQSGNVDTIRRHFYRTSQFRYLADDLEDWAVLDLPVASPRQSFIVCTEKVNAGDTLYLLGYDVHKDNKTLLGVPLIVLNVTSDEKVPNGLIFVKNPTGRNLNSWSGGAVARKHGENFEFVGVLSNGRSNKAAKEAGSPPFVHTVVRPPMDVLQSILMQ